VPLWQQRPHAAALLAPGDKVSFTPVSVREYEMTLAKVAEGSFEIAPTEVAVGAAA
jgi:hypothetical protein